MSTSIFHQMNDPVGGEPTRDIAPMVRDSLSNQAYWRIRNALKQSHYQPGQKLVLRTVATELNISLTPLREAFARLLSENALSVDARGIVSVPMISLEQHKEIRDLRIELEGRAAFAATAFVSDRQIVELRALNEAYFQATVQGDQSAAFKANEEFHFRLYALAQMPILFSIIEGLWMRSGPILAQARPRARAPVRRHGRILMGLELRDPELVRQGISEDITNGWAARQEQWHDG